MGKRPEVSLEKRAEINVLLSEGLSQKEIAFKLNISQSAVSKIIKRIIEFGTYTPKPRPGRPRVRKHPSKIVKPNTSLPNIKTENGFSYERGNSFNHERTESFPFVDAKEDNFFLSLCEIENSIKDDVDKPEKKVFEYEFSNCKFETEKNKQFGNSKFQEDNFTTFVSLEGKKIKSEFKRPETEKRKFVNSKFQEDNFTTFVTLEGKKIKSEGKRPYSPSRTEKKRHNSPNTKLKRYEDVRTVEKRTNNFIKTEKNTCNIQGSESRLPHKYIKAEKHYIVIDDDDDNDSNNFDSNDNYQNDNEMSYDDQVFYPSFSKKKPLNKSNTTEYFKIYNKSLKRHYRKSDIQIKPTKFVKISERKRSHEKRNQFVSSPPQKLNFNKKHYY